MVDCGYGRDGVLPKDPEAIQMVLDIEQSVICEFFGIYTHGGHSYESNSSESIRKVACDERDAGECVCGSIVSFLLLILVSLTCVFVVLL